MDQTLEMTLEQSTPRITGGITVSMFPLVDKLLLQRPILAALEGVAPAGRLRRAYSVVDFPFLSVYPIWSPDARRFYKGAGPPLRDMRHDKAFYDECSEAMIYVIRECIDGGPGAWRGRWKELCEKARTA